MLFSVLWLNSDVLLFSTDNNVGSERYLKDNLPDALGGCWGDNLLVGGGGITPLSATSIALWLMPLGLYVNGIHAFYLIIASIALALFLRMRGLEVPTAIIVAIATGLWVGCNFTMVYAGHTGKFGTLAFTAVALLCIEETVRRGSVAWAVVAGGAMGMAMIEQQDVALFFGIFWGAYALFACFRRYGRQWRLYFKLLGPVAGVVLLIAGPAAIVILESQTVGVSPGGDESPSTKWDFVTQWSQPPDETVELLAPGYMGWRSGEPEGPYWGRCGRSAEWERSRQGFMNFRLDGLYIGAIPIVFALFAVVAALFARRKNTNSDELGVCWKERRAEILFWGAVAVITLLLAYGKFTPLYWLFYQLPVVNNIRAPVKFLQVFQVVLAILAAYGFDFAVQWFNREKRAVRQ
jgi:hypothetical protein